MTVVALFLRWPVAGLERFGAGLFAIGGHDELRVGLPFVPRPRQHHLVVDEIPAIRESHQHVGAMDVARVQRRHSKRGGPGLQVFLENGLVAARLFGPSKPGVNAKGSLRIDTRLRSCATASKVTLALAEVPPENFQLRSRTRPLTRGAGAPNTRRASSCTKNAPSSNGMEFEAAGEHDARAARLRRRVIPVDHLLQPDRLAAEIHIVGARRDAGGKQIGAVELVGTDSGYDQLRLIDHRPQRSRIGCVRHDQRRVSGCADRIANGGELVPAAPGHRPCRRAVTGIACSEIFGDELAGVSRCAVDDDVELRGHVLTVPYASTANVSPALSRSRLISLCCIAAPGVQNPAGTSVTSRNRHIAHSEIIFEVEP